MAAVVRPFILPRTNFTPTNLIYLKGTKRSMRFIKICYLCILMVSFSDSLHQICILALFEFQRLEEWMGSILLGQPAGGGGGAKDKTGLGVWARLKAGLLRLGPSRRHQAPILPEAAYPLKVIIDSELSGVIYSDIGANYEHPRYFAPSWPYKGKNYHVVVLMCSPNVFLFSGKSKTFAFLLYYLNGY